MEATGSEKNHYRNEVFLLSIKALHWTRKGPVSAKHGGSVSPFALEVFLAMTLIGTKTRAYNEIATLIKKQQKLDKPLKLLFDSISNTISSCKQSEQNLTVESKIVTAPTLRVKPQFCDNLETLTKIEVETGEFNLFTTDYTQDFLQRWLGCTGDETTNTQLIPQKLITNYTKAVLVNQIIFTGEWLYPFPSNWTHTAPFWLSPNFSITVNMMKTQAVVPHVDLNFLNASAVNLPYKDSSVALMIIVPHKYNGLEEIEESLQRVNLNEIKRHMKESELLIHLPKFTVDFVVDYKPFFVESGVTTAFTNKADLNDLFEPISVPLSNIVQRTRFVVDENGATPGVPQPDEFKLFAPPCFLVNRPFFYFLWDTSTEAVFSMVAVRDLNQGRMELRTWGAKSKNLKENL